ncbi:microtubule-associated protein 6-like isoform X2 [Solea solea]|uniref:microtubule-associated protein 6-like isoform X2 n=1 Tax=Solea solea TaxID=90069 RepID=UPI00272BC731|nr:microtubule-associated protein 6-like isoform X2 [Solea solea]
MAWPCITRACCINRFWTELDKADIAVPLVFTKYSDVAEAQRLPHHLHRHQRAAAVAIETQQQPPPGGEPQVKEAPPAAAAAAGAETRGSAASVMRQDFRAWRVRPEPSCRPRDEYQPTTGPFNNQTQYQKDYKAWPIPKKHDHPWIHRTESEGGVEKSQVEEKLQEKKKKVEEKKEVKVQEEKKKEVKTVEEKVQDMKVPEKKLEEKKVQEEKVQEEKKVEIKVQEEEKVEIKVQEEKKVEIKVQEEKKVEEVKESKVETVRSVRREKSAEKKKLEEQKRDRAAADALNRQIQEVMSTSSSYRTEFKAYKNVKPVKAFKAPAQYKPPVEETSLETSYSATFKGEQGKAPPSDNKLQERRRIRSLYSEPSSKEPKDSQTESSSVLNLL